MARSQPASRPIRSLAALLVVLVTLVSACTDPYRLPYVLTDEPVVVGLSVAVIEGGPYATDLAALPADRPRAEVLPLDTVELDALVVDVDGPRPLDDAAWVLCGDGCLGSLVAQGERYGGLEPCAEDSAERSYACLAGRGERPRVAMPAILPGPRVPGVVPAGAFAFLRAAVIVGRDGGPTTDECLAQLLGPREQLWGCAIGVRELPYGPIWALRELAEELQAGGSDVLDQPGLPQALLGSLLQSPLPELVTDVLAPNSAPRIQAVRIGSLEDPIDPSAEPRPIDAPIELAAGTEIVMQLLVAPRDRQLVLNAVGPDSWVGSYEGVSVQGWSDAALGRSFGAYSSLVDPVLAIEVPEEEGPVHLYLLVTDSRSGISWLGLELRVVER